MNESGFPGNLEIFGKGERLIPIGRFELVQKLANGLQHRGTGNLWHAHDGRYLQPGSAERVPQSLCSRADDVGVDQPSSWFQEAERLPDDLALFVVIEMMQCVGGEDDFTVRALRNEALKLAEVADAEIDSRYQRAQPGPRQIHHRIRSVDADHTRLEETAPETLR